LFGFYSGAKCKSPLFRKSGEMGYKKDIFLNMLKSMLKKHFDFYLNAEKASFYIWTSEKDSKKAARLLEKCGCLQGKKLVAVSPFAKSDTKSWPVENFLQLIKRIKADSNLQVVLIGSRHQEEKCRKLKDACDSLICNLCGKTNLRVLAEVLKKCHCLITNDSASMHLGAAVDVPTVAIFGPTDLKKYAPKAKMHRIISAGLSCQPCEKAQCGLGSKPSECLKAIGVDEIFDNVKQILKNA